MNLTIGKKFGNPPKYVRPMTNEELFMRMARIIYMHPGGKSEANVASDTILNMLKREGLLR